MPINTLIVGLGKIGMLYDIKKKVYLTHSKCIQKNKNFNLVGGIDLSLKNSKIFIKKFKKPVWREIRKYDQKKKIDFVIVSTLPVKRYQIIKDIIKYIKPQRILIEKPVSYNLNTLNSIIKISKKNDIKIFINYPRISSNLIKYLGNKIEKIKNNSFKKIIITVPNPIKTNIFHYIQLLFYLLKKNNYKSSYLFKPIKRLIKKNFVYLHYNNFEIFFIFETNLNYRSGNFDLFFDREQISFERSVTKLITKKFKYKNSFFSDQKAEIIKKFQTANNQNIVYENIFKNIKKKNATLVDILDEKIILKFYIENICN